MTEQQTVQDQKGNKPCVCNIGPLKKMVRKATGNQTEAGQVEYRCPMCGATEWRTP
jgi:hypothetical protein